MDFNKFCAQSISGTLIIFKPRKINYFGVKSPESFLKLDDWIHSKINYA